MSTQSINHKSSKKSLHRNLNRSRKSITLMKTPINEYEWQPGYPQPTPKLLKKSDFFDPSCFKELETHVMETPTASMESFTELLTYLSKNAGTDLAKVRIIFLWLVSQKVPLLLSIKQIPSENTPTGFLHQIRMKKATYAQLFAKMCRQIEIPCVVVEGMAKSVAYEVGAKISPTTLRNSWNAVYINDSWHLVHPYWAAMSAQGYTSGRWNVVDCPDFHTDTNCRRISSESFIVHTMVNEFFFLTDPEHFITKCLPDKPEWQLLANPISKEQFEELPFLQPTFYLLGLSLPLNDKCIIYTSQGQAEIVIKMHEQDKKYVTFPYKLYRLRESNDEGEYDYFHMERFVFHYVKDFCAHFLLRFPPLAIGEYKLEIHCRHEEKKLVSEWICDFRIICTRGMAECSPLPIVPAIGWGAGAQLQKHNIVAKCSEDGLVDADANLITNFRFGTDGDTQITAELLSSHLPREDLTKCVKVKAMEEGDVLVRVKVPQEGEYALQIFAKADDTPSEINVCNFLLQRTKFVEDEKKMALREKLRKATEEGEGNIEELLGECTRLGVEDKGDITLAKRAFLTTQFDKELRDAIASKDLDKLDKIMQNLSETSLKRSISISLLEDVDHLRSRLRKLKRLRKAVLEMDAKSISEIRSYPKPPKAVHGVMAATFLILGNRESELQKWSKVQGLISKKGKEGLKRRVANMVVSQIKPPTIARAKEILSKYDLESVQIASAGAAVFYQWSITMIHDAEMNHQEKAKAPPKTAKEKDL